MRRMAQCGDVGRLERPIGPVDHTSWRWRVRPIVILSVVSILVVQAQVSVAAFEGTDWWTNDYQSEGSPNSTQELVVDINGALVTWTSMGLGFIPALSEQWETAFHTIFQDQEYKEAVTPAGDEYGTGTAAEVESGGTDADGDGVLDHADACPASDVRAMVILHGRYSGVENILFEDGCTLADLIQEALAGGGVVGLGEILAELLAELEEGDFLTADELEILMEHATAGDEITDGVPVEIRYRFYTAEQRGRARLASKPEWVKAIEWWIERYNKHCPAEDYPEIVGAVDLGDVLNTARAPLGAKKEVQKAAEAEPRYYRKQKFATNTADEAKYQGKSLWVVGLDELADFLSTNYADAHRVFHIGLFDDIYGKRGWTHGVWYIDTNMIAVRANPVTKVREGRRHEMGHLFGLPDDVGGIMTKPDNKHYGDPDVWGKTWCKIIAAHLGIAIKASGDS